MGNEAATMGNHRPQGRRRFTGEKRRVAAKKTPPSPKAGTKRAKGRILTLTDPVAYHEEGGGDNMKIRLEQAPLGELEVCIRGELNS